MARATGEQGRRGDDGRQGDAPGEGGPGLRVALSVRRVEDVTWDAAVAVRVDVEQAARPLRVSVYLDGDLVDTWVPGPRGYELRLPRVRGRHVVTARAIDAAGRWGGASTLLDLGAA